MRVSPAEAQLKWDLAGEREMFLNAASHELRSPATSIIIYAQMLQKSLQQASHDNCMLYAELINESVEQLTEGIDRALLLCSRCSADSHS